MIVGLCFYGAKFKIPLDRQLQATSVNTRFSTTYFEIYDKSTADSCNRLIIIYPFRWYLLSQQNQLFVIDSESGYDCPANMMPGVQIDKTNDLSVVCLTMNSITALAYYSDVQPVRLDFSLEGKERFTILDAVNLLLDEQLVTFINEDEQREIGSLAPGPLRYIPLKVFIGRRYAAGNQMPTLERKKELRTTIDKYMKKNSIKNLDVF